MSPTPGSGNVVYIVALMAEWLEHHTEDVRKGLISNQRGFANFCLDFTKNKKIQMLPADGPVNGESRQTQMCWETEEVSLGLGVISAQKYYVMFIMG